MINAQGIARLLEKYGRQITIRALTHASGPAYDPSCSTVDTAVYGVIITSYEDSGNDLTTPVTMQLVTNSPINSGDRVIDGNDQYSIISVEKVNPGPTTYLYIAKIGKA